MDANRIILQHVRTSQEVDILLSKIDDMLDALYQLNQANFTDIFAGELPSTLSRVIQDVLIQNQLSFAKPAEMKNFLTELKNLLQTITLLTLTISFAPSDEAISQIAAKAKELFGLTTILEINTQASILAGATVIHGGKYLDYSLLTKLNTIFKTRSKDILSVLK